MQRLPLRSDWEQISRPDGRLNLYGYDKIIPMTVTGLHKLCADRELDYVIDRSRLESYFLSSHDDNMTGRSQTFYLYGCQQLRVRGRT